MQAKIIGDKVLAEEHQNEFENGSKPGPVDPDLCFRMDPN